MLLESRGDSGNGPLHALMIDGKQGAERTILMTRFLSSSASGQRRAMDHLHRLRQNAFDDGVDPVAFLGNNGRLAAIILPTFRLRVPGAHDTAHWRSNFCINPSQELE